MEVDANTPKEASRKALEMQRDPGSLAIVYKVRASSTDYKWTTIDLLEYPASTPAQNRQARLQDLLLGWITLVEEDHANELKPELDRLNDLYQEAGNLCLDETTGDVDDNQPDADRIRQFFMEKLLPVVING